MLINVNLKPLSAPVPPKSGRDGFNNLKSTIAKDTCIVISKTVAEDL